MRILIDADGCPVVGITIDIADEFNLPVIILADYAHQFFAENNVEVILCDQGKDSVDFAILKHAQVGDVVITQDYGLATLLLAKNVHVLSQNGLRYRHDNVDQLLLQRHTSAKIRRVTKHCAHIKKRTKEDDDSFTEALVKLLKEIA